MQHTAGRRVGDRDRLAVAGVGGEGGTGGRGQAVIGHPHMLDFGFVNVAQRVGCLDVVIHELVAEVRQRRVVDLGEVIIGNDRIRPESRIENEVIDLAVGRGRIERGARLGQDALGHVDRDPLTDLQSARIGFVLVRVDRVDAVGVDADLDLYAIRRNSVDVIGVRPDVEPGRHPFEESGVVDVRLLVEPPEREPTRVVGETLRLEHGRGDFVFGPAGRRHEILQPVDGILGRERRLHLIVVAETAVVVESGIKALQINVPSQFHVVGLGPSPVPVVGRGNLPRLDITAFLAQHLLGRLQPVGAGHERRVAEKFEREAGRLHVDLRARVRCLAAVRHRGDRRLDPFEEVGRAVTHFGENPRAVLDVGVGGDRTFDRVDEILGSGRLVSAPGRVVEEL